MIGPFPAIWTGSTFDPLPRFIKTIDAAYGLGEVVTLVPHEARSQAGHNHYFAAVHEAWLNLPEGYGDRFPTADHLRKFALIKSGSRDERSIVCASKAEALRLAAFVKPMDEFAVVTVSEAVVTVYTAKSQSQKAMGKQAFQASKEAVLGVLADLIGVTPEQLSPAARAPASANNGAGGLVRA